MFRVKNNSIPLALQEKFPFIQYNYPTNFSKNNFKEPKLNLRKAKFIYHHQELVSGTNLTTEETKAGTYDKLFTNITKDLLLNMETKLLIFKNFKLVLKN